MVVILVVCQCACFHNNVEDIIRASCIPRHAHFHAAQENLPFATEFAACRNGKTELPIFATFISNSWFFGLLFNFIIYKTIKSCHCKLSYGPVLLLLR